MWHLRIVTADSPALTLTLSLRGGFSSTSYVLGREPSVVEAAAAVSKGSACTLAPGSSSSPPMCVRLFYELTSASSRTHARLEVVAAAGAPAGETQLFLSSIAKRGSVTHVWPSRSSATEMVARLGDSPMELISGARLRFGMPQGERVTRGLAPGDPDGLVRVATSPIFEIAYTPLRVIVVPEPDPRCGKDDDLFLTAALKRAHVALVPLPAIHAGDLTSTLASFAVQPSAARALVLRDTHAPSKSLLTSLLAGIPIVSLIWLERLTGVAMAPGSSVAALCDDGGEYARWDSMGDAELSAYRPAGVLSMGSAGSRLAPTAAATANGISIRKGAQPILTAFHSTDRLLAPKLADARGEALRGLTVAFEQVTLPKLNRTPRDGVHLWPDTTDTAALFRVLTALGVDCLSLDADCGAPEATLRERAGGWCAATVATAGAKLPGLVVSAYAPAAPKSDGDGGTATEGITSLALADSSALPRAERARALAAVLERLGFLRLSEQELLMLLLRWCRVEDLAASDSLMATGALTPLRGSASLGDWFDSALLAAESLSKGSFGDFTGSGDVLALDLIAGEKLPAPQLSLGDAGAERLVQIGHVNRQRSRPVGPPASEATLGALTESETYAIERPLARLPQAASAAAAFPIAKAASTCDGLRSLFDDDDEAEAARTAHPVAAASAETVSRAASSTMRSVSQRAPAAIWSRENGVGDVNAREPSSAPCPQRPMAPATVLMSALAPSTAPCPAPASTPAPTPAPERAQDQASASTGAASRRSTAPVHAPSEEATQSASLPRVAPVSGGWVGLSSVHAARRRALAVVAATAGGMLVVDSKDPSVTFATCLQGKAVNSFSNATTKAVTEDDYDDDDIAATAAAAAASRADTVSLGAARPLEAYYLPKISTALRELAAAGGPVPQAAAWPANVPTGMTRYYGVIDAAAPHAASCLTGSAPAATSGKRFYKVPAVVYVATRGAAGRPFTVVKGGRNGASAPTSRDAGTRRANAAAATRDAAAAKATAAAASATSGDANYAVVSAGDELLHAVASLPRSAGGGADGDAAQSIISDAGVATRLAEAAAAEAVVEAEGMSLLEDSTSAKRAGGARGSIALLREAVVPIASASASATLSLLQAEAARSAAVAAAASAATDSDSAAVAAAECLAAATQARGTSASAVAAGSSRRRAAAPALATAGRTGFSGFSFASMPRIAAPAPRPFTVREDGDLNDAGIIHVVDGDKTDAAATRAPARAPAPEAQPPTQPQLPLAKRTRAPPPDSAHLGLSDDGEAPAFVAKRRAAGDVSSTSANVAVANEEIVLVAEADDGAAADLMPPPPSRAPKVMVPAVPTTFAASSAASRRRK